MLEQPVAEPAPFAPPPVVEQPVAQAAAQEEPLDLGLDLGAEVPPAPAAQEDELLLGGGEPPRVARGEPEQPRQPAAGSTLFERMANLSRGASRAAGEDEDGDEGSSLSIPRFLGRQNNQ